MKGEQRSGSSFSPPSETHKEMLQKMKNSYTEEYIFSCLACCEAVIDRNMYLAAKWKNAYPAGETYLDRAEKWMKCRSVLRGLLSERYSTKEIIQRSKACKKKATQKAVMDLIVQIRKGDVQLEK